jgi:hypothetical protein
VIDNGDAHLRDLTEVGKWCQFVHPLTSFRLTLDYFEGKSPYGQFFHDREE